MIHDPQGDSSPNRTALRRSTRGLAVLAAIGSLMIGNPDRVVAQDEEPTDVASVVAAEDDSAAAPVGAGAMFREALERVEPSLVVIESFGGATVSSGQIGGLKPQGEGATTGVVVSADGLVVTSTFHFIGRPTAVTAVTADGTRYVARLVAQDLTRNLCLLRLVGAEGLPVPEFAGADRIEVGRWVASVGTGYGDRNAAISVGIISAVGRASGRAIQTDANTSPANYGGPLLDLDGRIVGICVPLNPTAPGPAAGVEWYDSGIGFAIPLDFEASWWERLTAGEQLEFGFLGIEPGESSDDASESGVPIGTVAEGSPAAAADLRAGDRIVSIGGRAVPDRTQLGVEIRRYLAGDSVRLEVRREEETLSIDVTLGRSPGQSPELAPIRATETPIEPPAEGEPTPDGG